MDAIDNDPTSDAPEPTLDELAAEIARLRAIPQEGMSMHQRRLHWAHVHLAERNHKQLADSIQRAKNRDLNRMPSWRPCPPATLDLSDETPVEPVEPADPIKAAAEVLVARVRAISEASRRDLLVVLGMIPGAEGEDDLRRIVDSLAETLADKPNADRPGRRTR